MTQPEGQERLSILLIGNTERSEFRQGVRTLGRLGRVVEVSRPEEAADLLGDDRMLPDVIVIAQSYPAQFPARSIEHLRRLAPLARVVGLLGSWCEGELRTGRPWPATIRTYWHQWEPRCTEQLGRLGRGESSAWGLPVTATEEERLLLQAAGSRRRRGLVAIHTHSFEMQDWLSSACRSCGMSTVWLRPPRPARVEGATAAIFEGSDCREEQLDELRHLAAALRPAPIVALLDFPRIEDRRRALSAGAAAVVSKPLQLEDLFWEMDRALEGSAAGVGIAHHDG